MELDYSEIHHGRTFRRAEQAESMQDKHFGEILTMGLNKSTNGNWEAPLPFKSDNLSLQDNKGYYSRSLPSLMRRVLNEGKLKEDLLAFMKKTLDNGHASRVSVNQLGIEKGKAWHLPHFLVYHPRKPIVKLWFSIKLIAR